MRIMGVDPGLAITGFGFVEEHGGNFRWIASGCIRTGQESAASLRLEQIFNRVLELAGEYRPDALALEKLFFSKNTRTALQVGEARGTVILAASQSNLPLFEYTPLQVKQAVAGYGKAEKEQVQKMVQLLLQLKEIPAVDDEADALAVALCHLQHRRFQDAVKGGGA
ncbi:MAG: crossover junction endodeoxyribonuclease RuvC [Bacillota bacterium]